MSGSIPFLAPVIARYLRRLPVICVASRQHRFRNRKKLTNKSGSPHRRHGPV